MGASNDYKVGQKVYFGRSKGERTLGEVVKINPKKLKVKQLESRGTMMTHPVGTVWSVPPSLVTPAPAGVVPFPALTTAKRPDVDIIQEIAGLYSQLSPERLHCDGEVSRSVAARRGAAFNRRLKECFVEIGRQVHEDEAYRVVDAYGASQVYSTYGGV